MKTHLKAQMFCFSSHGNWQKKVLYAHLTCYFGRFDKGMLCKTLVETHFFFTSCIFFVDDGDCTIHNILSVVQKSHCQVKLETAETCSSRPPRGRAVSGSCSKDYLQNYEKHKLKTKMGKGTPEKVMTVEINLPRFRTLYAMLVKITQGEKARCCRITSLSENISQLHFIDISVRSGFMQTCI